MSYLINLTPQQIAIRYLTMKDFDRNDLANKEWRKTIFRMFFLYGGNTKKKGGE